MGQQPQHVADAVVTDDLPILSRCGRKGGIASAEQRERERILRGEREDAATCRLAEDELSRQQATNEDIMPVD